jgi:hypothetical protein
MFGQHICEVKKPRGRLATSQQVLAYSTSVTVHTAQAFAGALSDAFEVGAKEEAKKLYAHMLEELGLEWHPWEKRDEGYSAAQIKEVLSELGQNGGT